jgi:hypothetical protein
MIVPAVNAHYLPAPVAQDAANAFGQRVANNTDGATEYGVRSCRNRGPHKYVCRLTVVGEDASGAFVCRGKIVVKVGRSSYKVRTRLASPRCRYL